MTVTDEAVAFTGGSETDALLARLGRLRERVALLVDRRSVTDPTAGDPMRGLYLPEEAVRQLLLRSPEPEPERELATPATELAHSPADRLAALRLTDLDTALLLVALAPDLDRTFEPLYGYLNDDVSRRRATVGLALDLCGVPAHQASGRARFLPTAPLSVLGLLTVEEPEHPFLSRSLRVSDRVVAHLLGDDTPDASLTGHLHPLPVPSVSHDGQEPGPDGEFTGFVDRLAALLAEGPPLAVYVRERHEGDGLVCVSSALHAAGVAAVRYSGPVERVPELLREARLSGRTVVVGALSDQPGALVRALTDAVDVSVLIAGARPYDPQWCESDPLILEAPRQRAAAVRAWTDAVGEQSGFDVRATVAPYHLGADRIARAARAAHGLAAFDGTPMSAAHLRLAARQQSASGLEQHARRIRPAVDWRDLVLPERSLTQLHELALRARHRDRVLGDWRLSAGGGRGRGVLGLFAGSPAPARRCRRRSSRPNSAWISMSFSCRRSSTSTSARPRRTSNGSSRRPTAPTPCSSSTRPTPSSASAPR